ncbi:MAG: ABC transporter ATP-binding protein [Phycisphaerae bacterium]|nr:ABC transporter ATP-binding protein [Phycisphaerae bacterium]
MNSQTKANDEIVLRCEGLTKQYDEIIALDNLYLQVRRGQIFGYIGHNGAGKTTTIRILAGLLKATSGKAEICGLDVHRGVSDIKMLVGYMPDSFGVYDQMRVWEYLDFFGAAFKIPRKQRFDRMEYVLDITEAEYLRDRFVDTLSKGMKQRVGIARTLMHDPQVLLLDEPASGLDPRARVQMRHLLRKLADRGKTLLVSSHILPELAAVCDTVGIIHEGVLRVSGPIQDVLNQIQRDRLMEVRCFGSRQEVQKILQQQIHCHDFEGVELENALQFRFTGDDESLAGIVETLNLAGQKVVTLREVPLSLEDAYMTVSGTEYDEETEEEKQEEETEEQPAGTG